MGETSWGIEDAEAMGRRLQGLACRQARADYEFTTLVGEFDAGEGWAAFGGIKSCAHYLAWACSLSPGAAREQVRVARALRGLPLAAELFAQGRLSYSKIRELTRVADHLAEAELCELAQEMTASQLARTVAAYRAASGTRVRQVDKRVYTCQARPDGMVRVSLVVPAEEAALIDAAVQAAARAGQASEASDLAANRPEAPDLVQGMLDVAASYLDGAPREPADDHTLVVVEVSAESLVGAPETTEPSADAPNGRDDAALRGWAALSRGTCHVPGYGRFEPASAQRLACTALVQGVLTSPTGEVLKLGRARRLASRAQRRALRVRDRGVCQFPGCHQTRHLDAHHLLAWGAHGPTDLDNLVLVCRRHHVLIHEGGLVLTRTDRPWRRFAVHLPDGRLLSDNWLAGVSAGSLGDLLIADAAAREAGLLGGSFTAATEDSPDAAPDRIAARHGGEGFSLHECVRVLFDLEEGGTGAAA